MKNLFFFISLLLFCLHLSAQSKKQIRDYGIRSLIETHIEYNNNEEVRKFVKEKIEWDKNGNISQEELYSKTGALISKRIYTYKGKKLLEEKHEVNQRKKEGEPNDYKHFVYSYNGQNRIGRTDFNKEGNIVGKEEYRYNRFGDKVEEIEFNDKGEILSKTSFLYSKKGLKKERVKTDAGGNIVSRITYEYTF
jgi:hypothetical protein